MPWLSTVSNAFLGLLWICFASHVVSDVDGFDLNKPFYRPVPTRLPLALVESVDDPSRDSSSSSSLSSVLLELDPNGPYANFLLSEKLGLSTTQCDQLRRYCDLIVEWNDKINLVSRKDCTVDTVFGRHVVPCLAPVLLDSSQQLQDGQRVIDVGTGGGFPGIPMAICYPQCQFLLVDSVGKKLLAVQDMVARLQLDNVQTKHSRAEQVTGQFDWCVGRSVASLPKYCSWIQHLLVPTNGKLLYIVGGDVPEAAQAVYERSIHDLFTDGDNDKGMILEGSSLISEKKILIFDVPAVQRMAIQ